MKKPVLLGLLLLSGCAQFDPEQARRAEAMAEAIRNTPPAYQVVPVRPQVNCTTMAMGGGMASTNCQ